MSTAIVTTLVLLGALFARVLDEFPPSCSFRALGRTFTVRLPLPVSALALVTGAVSHAASVTYLAAGAAAFEIVVEVGDDLAALILGLPLVGQPKSEPVSPDEFEKGIERLRAAAIAEDARTRDETDEEFLVKVFRLSGGVLLLLAIAVMVALSSSRVIPSDPPQADPCDPGDGGPAATCTDDLTACGEGAACPVPAHPQVCGEGIDLRPTCELASPCAPGTSARLFCCP